jgi:hypothetical protein
VETSDTLKPEDIVLRDTPKVVVVNKPYNMMFSSHKREMNLIEKSFLAAWKCPGGSIVNALEKECTGCLVISKEVVPTWKQMSVTYVVMALNKTNKIESLKKYVGGSKANGGVESPTTPNVNYNPIVVESTSTHSVSCKIIDRNDMATWYRVTVDHTRCDVDVDRVDIGRLLAARFNTPIVGDRVNGPAWTHTLREKFELNNDTAKGIQAHVHVAMVEIKDTDGASEATATHVDEKLADFTTGGRKSKGPNHIIVKAPPPQFMNVSWGQWCKIRYMENKVRLPKTVMKYLDEKYVSSVDKEKERIAAAARRVQATRSYSDDFSSSSQQRNKKSSRYSLDSM